MNVCHNQSLRQSSEILKCVTFFGTGSVYDSYTVLSFTPAVNSAQHLFITVNLNFFVIWPTVAVNDRNTITSNDTDRKEWRTLQ